MKSYSVSFLLLLCVQFLHGQDATVDSLRRKLTSTVNDTIKLEILNNLVEKINDEKVWTVYNDEMGLLSDSVSNSADIKTKKIAQKYYASYLQNLGYLYDVHGNIPKAIEYFRRSLKIQEQVGDNQGMADVLSNIGNIYRGQGDLGKALDYYLKGLAIRKSINDTIGIANSFYSIGIISKLQGDTDKTIEYFVESLKMHQRLGHLMGVADVQLNIGDIYLMKGDIHKALSYYTDSYKIHKQIGDEEGTVNSLSKLGNLYFEQHQLNDALLYGTMAMSLSQKLGYPHLIRNSALLLQNIYRNQHQYEKAIDMNDLYFRMRDSIMNESTRKATIDQQLQYEFEKREALLKATQEKQNLLAKDELYKQKIISYAIAAASVALIVSAMLVLLFYKRKQDAVMQHKITDSRLRAINAQMNPHFIFNCMSSIQTLISNKDLINADQCLVRFAKLIRKVLDNSTKKEITLHDDLETLHDYVELEKIRLDYPLTYNVTIDQNIDASEIMIPPLLIQPFVENAILHGLKSKAAPGTISINIKKDKGRLELIIADNGIGRNAETKSDQTNSRKSYGIPLIKERLDYLGQFNNCKADYSVVDIYNNGKIEGTKVSLIIPLVTAA